MGLVVGAFEEVDVVRGDQPESEVAGNVDQSRAVAPLLFDPVIGQFDEEVFLSEDVPVSGGILEGLRLLARAQGHVDLPLEATAQRDQPLAVTGEKLTVHARLVIEAVKMGGRAQLHQVAVSLVVGGEESHVESHILPSVGRLLLVHRTGGDVDLASDDRLHLRFLGGLVELDRAEEISVVCQGDRRHAKLGRLPHELLHPDGSIQERILAMDVQVDEGRLGHLERLVRGCLPGKGGLWEERGKS